MLPCTLHATSTQMSQTGLFSAATAALLTVSTQGLQQNSADVSAFYLAKLYQLQANGTASQISIPSSLSPSSNFSAPNHVVLVNAFWFLSFAISITCALGAMLVQQWAYRYIKLTQQSYSPQKQARIRAFFAEGHDKFHLPLVVELLPTFVHISIFLFFAGLGVFLFHLNHKIFIAVIWWLGLCALAYMSITFMPIFWHDSPYHSPLSPMAWHLWTGVLRICLMILGWFTGFGSFSYASWERIQYWQERYRKWFQYGIQKAAEESAQELSSEIDGRSLVWTLESFIRDQIPDNKQEDFIRGIPAFCKSMAIRNPLGGFKVPHAENISEALVGLLHHTLSSKSVDQDRIDICIGAIRDASLPITLPILRRVIYKDWEELLYSVDFVELLRTTTYGDQKTDYYSKCVIAAHIRATAQEHDDRWFELATGQLCTSRAILEGYLTHGDSVLLANCIDICRRTIVAYSENDWVVGAGWRSKCFQIVSDFDPSNTLPELQHEFCRQWNELVRIVSNPEDRRMQTLAMLILRHIRKIYIALHQGTDATPTAFDTTTDDYANVLFYPSSYPSCYIPRHFTHTHEGTASTIGMTTHARGPTSHTVTPIAPAVPSPSASYQDHPTRGVTYGTTLGGAPDASQRTTQVAPSTRPTLAPLESHPGLDTARDVAASTSIPLQGFAPPSSGTIEAPGMLPSFPPATVPGHMPPADWGPFSYSLPSQFDQIPIATTISLTSPQANLNVAETDAPTPVQAPHDGSYQTTQSGPEIAPDISLGTAPSPREVDRSQ